MSDEEVQSYYDFILPLVLDAGKELTKVDEIDVETKTAVWDLVTIHDRKIEEILIKRIKAKYTDHKWIGEEESDSSGNISTLTDAPTWIIDPIDGTANFVRKLPITGISVGLVINKEPILGVIYNPFMEELFTALKGKGAFFNGKRIRTSGCSDIQKSVFNYELSVARRNNYWYTVYMYRLKHIAKVVTGIRSLGCAVLGLSYVACGRLDAYQVDGLYPWDVAAGGLIVKEAGGYLIDTSGKEFDLMNPNIIAAASKELAEQFVEVEKAAEEEIENALKQNKEFIP